LHLAYSRRLIVLGVLALSACSLIPKPPTVPTVPVPPPIVSHRELLSVSVPGATALLELDAERGGPYTATADSTGLLVFTIPLSGPWGEVLTVTAPGYVTSQTRLTMCAADCNQPNIILVPALPPVPTRAQVTAVKLTFQGLTVCTAQLGCIPWFEPFIVALTNPADRKAVYAAKHAQGDTHLIVECFSSSRPVYNEAPFTGIIAPNCDADPQTFLSLVEEVIQNGFTPIVTYDGDNGDGTPFGSTNAEQQLPVLAALLRNSQYGDLNPYVLYFRGWDSVFYGSSPANIQAFGKLFRASLPSGYLAIEFNIGHIPLGNGPADYDPGGAMEDYDVIMGEFDNWPYVGAAEWEILWRMLGLAYIHDAHEAPDTYGGQGYLYTGSPRGPYAFSCFEWAEYSWTHGQLTTAQYLAGYAWYKARGCPNF
jgi:hypothetical protein